MLADRTNLGSTSPASLRGAKQVDSSRLPRTLPVLVQQENGRHDEDEEYLRRLRDEHAKIPTLLSRFDEVCGSAEDRANTDSAVLKKLPPDSKQPIATKIMEHLRQETTRLSEGYKKLRSQRDTWYHELVEVQRSHQEIFEKGLYLATKYRQDKAIAVKKLQELEGRCLNDRLQSARAKAALSKEADSVTRAQNAAEEATQALKAAEKTLADMQALELVALEKANGLSDAVQSQKIELQSIKQQLSEINKQRLLLDAKHAEEMEAESARGSSKCSSLQETLRTLNASIRDLSAEHDRVLAEIQRLGADNQRKESQLESLKQRAISAETKVNAKEDNLNLALQSMTTSQQYSAARIEALEKENDEVQERIENINSETAVLSDRLFESSGALQRMRDRTDQMTSRIVELERKVSEADGKLKAVVDQAELAKIDSSHKVAKCLETDEALARALDVLAKEESATLEAEEDLRKIKAEQLETEESLSATRSALDALKSSPTKMARILREAKEEEELKRRAGDANYYKERVELLQAELVHAKEALHEADNQRRKLLNEVQNLKGNIRVVARVRPASAASAQVPEQDRSRLICSVDGNNLSLEVRGNQQRRGASATAGSVELHPFSFNRVFDKEASQHVVFEEVASFVQSALDGYSVCLFSYGQTGSGKTWTMTGDMSDPVNRGIIPRSVDHILCTISQMREKGWTFEVECSFIEIYNESIRDLLALDAKLEKSAKHDVQHRGQAIIVTNIRKVAVSEAEQVQSLLEQADRNRSFAPTDKNAHSSRSHSIFTIYLVGRNPEKPGAELTGSLNLCDLAGSERVKVSGATGDRLKETQAINASLSQLALVFNALGQKTAHVPFRNSVLTDILSPCLSGEGKTLMIVNLSGDHNDAQETLCSLRFAQQVNKTELGKAKKHIREVPEEAVTRGRNVSQ